MCRRVRATARLFALTVLGGLLCSGLNACRPRSDWDEVLAARARWTVLALDWAQTQDNTVLLSTRLSGPPNSALDTLTVRVVLRDAAGETIQEAWHVYDLTQVPRGGPKDFTLRIPSETIAQGLAVDIVARPAASDQPHIPELAGLAP